MIVLLGAVAALLAVDSSGVLGDGAAAGLLGDWLLWAAFAVAGVLSAIRARQVPAERLPWSLMATAWTSYVAGGLFFNISLDGSSANFPSLPDVLWLAWYPCAIAAFAILLRRRGMVPSRAVWLDGAIGALTVATIGALGLFSGPLDDGDALSAIYALMDLSVIGFVTVMAAIEGWRPDRTWSCVLLGVIGITVGDSIYLVQSAQGAWTTGNLTDLPYVAGAIFLSAALWQPHRPPVAPETATQTRLFTMPLSFAAGAITIEATDLLRDIGPFPQGLLTAALVLVVVRLGVTFKDYASVLATSRREALTDAITGLGNRRRLMLDLEAAVASGEPTVAAIFDLDGFKHYNDAFGHAAGDALLTRLGHALGTAVDGHGGAYRLGGDEFCVLLDGDRAATQALLARAVEALTEDGEGFAIANSHGAVELPSEVTTAMCALKTADQRMYAIKNGRPTSAFSQTRERFLLGVPALRDAARFVRSSHEARDGSGYPDALAGETIPLGARIISVCDAYAAMTADRPYRSAMPGRAAIAELRRCAGSQFDPAVVAAFCAVAAELDTAPPPHAQVTAA